MGGGDGAVSIKLTTDEKIAKALLNTIHLQAQHTALSLSFLSVLLKNKITSLSLPRIE